MTTPELTLRMMYTLNVGLIVPSLVAMVLHRGAGPVTPLGRITNSDGLRWLAISAGSGLAAGSGLGLAVPRLFIPLLIFQLVATLVFLGGYVAPLALRADWAAIPSGLTFCFVLVALIWPIALMEAM